jgi:hypothetical protein
MRDGSAVLKKLAIALIALGTSGIEVRGGWFGKQATNAGRKHDQR